MKNISKFLKYSVAIASIALLAWSIAFVGVFLVPTNSRDNQDPAKQKEMMALVLEWGQVAPFPTNATNVLIQAEGSSFTRSFRARFTAPKQDIEDWIKSSPGFNEVESE